MRCILHGVAGADTRKLSVVSSQLVHSIIIFVVVVVAQMIRNRIIAAPIYPPVSLFDFDSSSQTHGTVRVKFRLITVSNTLVGPGRCLRN